MRLSVYVPVYAATLLLSAFLLFAVQPLFGKMVLPLLGGTPSVWNTAMFFFQLTLLAGYAYAHATTRFLGIRQQAILHIALLSACVFVLPIAIPAGWSPPTDTDPLFWQLALMAVAVGGPFFVLAGTAPMLQRWFAGTEHKDSANPYFLYAASNLGSMSALLLFPVLIEPLMRVSTQSLAWAWGYGILILMIAVSAGLVWRRAGVAEIGSARKSTEVPERLTWKRRALWVLLAFVPSSLMLGVTTYITTDIASVPLLWIIPLAIYVGTFIIAFARREVISYTVLLWIQAAFFIIIVLCVASGVFPIHSAIVMVLNLGLYASFVLACHIDLARLRPHAGHLTEFYLLMSLGGALGGVFNALVAPNVFVIPVEYTLAMILALFLRFASDPEKGSFLKEWQYFRARLCDPAYKAQRDIFWVMLALLVCGGVMVFAIPFAPENEYGMAGILFLSIAAGFGVDKRYFFGLSASLALVGFMFLQWSNTHVLHQERNFFGVLRVSESSDGLVRILLHGTTLHGAQPLEERYRLTPISYYHYDSGIGDVYAWLDLAEGDQKVAGLGMGTGSIACYRKEGRILNFYEIDPAVVNIARNPAYFSYLSDCGTPYEVILGDGRLRIAGQADSTYDMIFLDIFSSDNIPVHVLSLEAFQIYQAKLKSHGMIAVNISNRYFDLRPVLSAIGQEMNLTVLFKVTKGAKLPDSEIEHLSAMYALFLQKPDQVAWFVDRGWYSYSGQRHSRVWRDDFADIVSALRIFGLSKINFSGDSENPEDSEKDSP